MFFRTIRFLRRKLIWLLTEQFWLQNSRAREEDDRLRSPTTNRTQPKRREERFRMSAPEGPPLQDNEVQTNATLEAEIKQMNSEIRKNLEKINTKDDTKALWVAKLEFWKHLCRICLSISHSPSHFITLKTSGDRLLLLQTRRLATRTVQELCGRCLRSDLKLAV